MLHNGQYTLSSVQLHILHALLGFALRYAFDNGVVYSRTNGIGSLSTMESTHSISAIVRLARCSP